MLVAFANEKDLQSYSESNCQYTESSIAFHAFTTEGGNPSIFAVVFQKKKVEAVEDWRGFHHLQQQFPLVNSEVIERVWQNQRSWNACFDVLSSFIASHGYAAVECEAMFDTSTWPSLPSALTMRNIASTLIDTVESKERSGVDNIDTMSDWTVVSLGHPQIPSRDSFSDHPADEDWDMIDTSPVDKRSASTVIAKEFPSSTARTVPRASYKDKLLQNSTQASANTTNFVSNSCNYASSTASIAGVKKWNPTIIVTNIPRKRIDREYVNSKTFSNAIDNEDEEARFQEEQEYMWELCCSGTGFYGLTLGSRRPAKQSRSALCRPTRVEIDKALQAEEMKMKQRQAAQGLSKSALAAIANSNIGKSSVGTLVPLFHNQLSIK